MSALNPVNPVLGYPCPLTLRCTVSGKENVFTDPAYIQARIARAGGLDKLEATYVCKAAKRLANEQASPPPENRTDVLPGGTKVAVQECLTPAGGKVTHREFRLKDGVCHTYVHHA
jgi:hypothetical protein